MAKNIRSLVASFPTNKNVLDKRGATRLLIIINMLQLSLVQTIASPHKNVFFLSFVSAPHLVKETEIKS